MRPQTKKMLRLLKDHGSVCDMAAKKAGVTNPRREAGLLQSREGLDISISSQTDKKREYHLNKSS